MLHNSPTNPSAIPLDYRGMMCPAPILNIAKTARQLKGRYGLFQILADDDAFPMDLKSWCRSSQAQLITIEPTANGAWRAVIAINPDAEPAPSPQRDDAADLARKHAATTQPAPKSASITPEPAAAAPASQLAELQEPSLVLDYRGMMCPQPVLKLARAMRQNQDKEQLVEILADDDAFPMDIRSWCRSSGFELIAIHEEQGVHRAIIHRERTRTINSSVLEAVRQAAHQTAPGPKNAPTQRAKPAGPPMPSPQTKPVQQVQLAQHAEPAHAAPAQPAAAAALPSAPPLDPDANLIELDLTATDPAQLTGQLDPFNALDQPNTVLSIKAQGSGSTATLVAWCASHNHRLAHLHTTQDQTLARIHLRANAPEVVAAPVQQPSQALVPVSKAASETRDACTLLVLHNDFEALMAALMIANASAAAGMEVTMFFTFWGVNLLRADSLQPGNTDERPNIFQRAFAWMMPKGPRRQQLGKLNFGGMGTSIMGSLMRKKNVMSLEAMMEAAAEQGVRFIVCTTSMTIMGLDKRHIMTSPNITYGGVAAFTEEASTSRLSLVF